LSPHAEDLPFFFQALTATGAFSASVQDQWPEDLDEVVAALDHAV